MVSLPEVALISTRDGSRARDDVEDQAARYHRARHELTINADFRCHQRPDQSLASALPRRTRRPQGDRAHVREWCEQVLVEVVLAARSSSWNGEQLDALLSPTWFSAARAAGTGFAHLSHTMSGSRGSQHARPVAVDPWICSRFMPCGTPAFRLLTTRFRLDKAEVTGSSPVSPTPVVTGDSATSGQRSICGVRPQCVPQTSSRACRMASAAGTRGLVSSSRIVPA